jgi:hypothetical protein
MDCSPLISCFLQVIVFIFRILTIVCRRRFRRGTIDSRSFDLDEFERGDSMAPKQSKSATSFEFTECFVYSAMHKSASTLTSLSAKASVMNAKISAAKSYRNSSVTSLSDDRKFSGDDGYNNNNNKSQQMEEKKGNKGQKVIAF